MALKGDRANLTFVNDYRFQVVNERGIGVVASGTTAGLKYAKRLDTAPDSSGFGGSFVGVLLDDVVSIDLTTTPPNLHKNEIPQFGDWPASIANGGWVWTDQVNPAHTISAGMTAYLAASGLFGSTPATASSGVIVGRWLSAKGTDGYAQLLIIPETY